nr:ankyrin repeat domain-containing protein [Gammaproteobacteria bacterium]
HDHGIDINHANEDNKPARTPIEAALISGHQQMADFLLSAGAAAPDLDVIDQFYIALLAANAPEARALVETTPELTEQVLKRFPALLEDAVNKRSADALSLMLSFGFDPNGGENRSALHQAAFTGSIELLKILIAAGGDTTRRDSYYFSPPMGWAIHNRQSDTVAFLETCAVDIFTASVRGLIPAVDELISTDPACLSLRFADLRPAPERYCGADWMTPLAFAIQGQHPATVRYLLELGADRSVTDPDGRSLLDYAQQFATDPDPESDGMKIVHLLSD